SLVSSCFLLLVFYLYFYFFFFFNDTATTEIYTLSLHDALPISVSDRPSFLRARSLPQTNWPSILLPRPRQDRQRARPARARSLRSEEHTSELQSRRDLVCRLLLEKKKKKKNKNQTKTKTQYILV